MKIVCLRTGTTLEKDLTITTAGPAMARRIREECMLSNISEESTEQIIKNYQLKGFQPFMFDVRV